MLVYIRTRECRRRIRPTSTMGLVAGDGSQKDLGLQVSPVRTNFGDSASCPGLAISRERRGPIDGLGVAMFRFVGL